MSNLHLEEARANALELKVATLQQKLDELATDYQATMRRAVAEKDEAERRLAEAERAGMEPSLEACEAAGRGPEQHRLPGAAYSEGGFSDTPEERARFEAYMRGHCWGHGPYDAEKGCYSDVLTRMLYGVWRDRGGLCAGHALNPKGDSNG